MKPIGIGDTFRITSSQHKISYIRVLGPSITVQGTEQWPCVEVYYHGNEKFTEEPSFKPLGGVLHKRCAVVRGWVNTDGTGRIGLLFHTKEEAEAAAMPDTVATVFVFGVADIAKEID